MIILKAKEFPTRSDLENKVRNLIGLTADMKPDYLIKGTRKELKLLHLSARNIFWGIRCEETDPKSIVKKKRINRGKIHRSRIKKTVDVNKSKEL